MTNFSPEITGGRARRAPSGDLVRTMSYEVMPSKGIQQDVLDHVPSTVPLTVTVTEAKGLDVTIELTECLVEHGYQVSPHLPARQFVDEAHLADVVARLTDAGVESVFVVGGDAPHAVGKFVDAFGLLQALEELGSPFHEVGIAGYPEGHGTIPREAIDMALKQKAPKATRILTQICFEAGTTSRWATGLVASGVNLPIFVGMPGPINRQKLVRISAGIGLGRSARFLRKQQSLLWRFLTPGGYNPTKLATQLAAEAARTVNTIRGLHIFTFNEIRSTERWRRELLASVVENQDRG